MWLRDGDILVGKVDLGPDVGAAVVVRVPIWVAAYLSSGNMIAGDALLDALKLTSVRVVSGSTSADSLEERTRC